MLSSDISIKIVILFLFLLFLGNIYQTFIIIQFIKNRQENRKVEARLRESEVRFKAAFYNTAVGTIIINEHGALLETNNAFCELLGFQRDEILDYSLFELNAESEREITFTKLRQVVNGQLPSFCTEQRIRHKNGRYLWVQVSMSPLSEQREKAQLVLVQFQDISLHKQYEAELRIAKNQAESLATIDHLTGLMNRRFFEKRLNIEYSRAAREGEPLSIIMVDIDNFKEINDIYGHQVGDRALKLFTSCLSANIRAYDFIGRYGGEEFIICLPNTNHEQARKIAERMRKETEDNPLRLVYLEEPIAITGSYGVATCKGYEEGIARLIRRADKAMYKAKRAGRNRVCEAETVI